MKLLRSIRTLDPSLGGSVEAVRQVCSGLPELGHSVEVVCLDAPDAPWLRDFPTRVHALGPAKGTYGYSRRFIPWMRDHAERYDAVVVDGVWQFHGWGSWLALRRSETPYFVHPHGMLDPWFKRKYPLKHIKKWAYWMLAEYRVLRDARAVLYTCEQERVLAQRSFWPYQAKEAVAGLGIETPTGNPNYQRQSFFNRFPELRDKRLILFVGRIHPKKGCDLLLEAFARVSHRDSTVHLVLVGPDRDGWQRKLQRQVVEPGLKHRITWAGMLSGDVKWGAFHAAEVFALPSHSENFGFVVAEAMACGAPVLISDKVNIWPEVEATGGGFVASDDLSGATELLERWLRLTPDEREKTRRRSQEGFAERFALHATLERFVSVLRALGVREGSGRGRSS
jgi:glycosyltransferase involved in cell wall biosynthesis